jgi:kynurenine formamidase
MMKIAFFVAAAALTAVPLVTPANAQVLTMAQVDMQTGLHIDDPAHYSKDRRRYDSNATVGVGPGGVTNGPRQSCRVETTAIKRDDGPQDHAQGARLQLSSA